MSSTRQQEETTVMETIFDADKFMREGQEIGRRAAEQFDHVINDAIHAKFTDVSARLTALERACEAAQVKLDAIERRVPDAMTRATAAEERARAKEDAEALVDQRIDAKLAEEKRLDGVLVNLRGAITTAAATV
jgi:hypothetical protein